MSVQKSERRKMYNNIDYSVEVNSIKRLAPSASRYNFRSGGSRTAKAFTVSQTKVAGVET